MTQGGITEGGVSGGLRFAAAELMTGVGNEINILLCVYMDDLWKNSGPIYGVSTGNQGRRHKR